MSDGGRERVPLGVELWNHFKSGPAWQHVELSIKSLHVRGVRRVSKANSTMRMTNNQQATQENGST